MRLTLTAFGHTLTLDAGLTCPEHEPGRDVDMGALVEHADTEPDQHADTEPDQRAELDARVRPEALGFRQR